MNEISTALKTLTDKITVKLEIGEKHFNVFLCIALCALVIYPLLFTAVVHFRTLPLGSFHRLLEKRDYSPLDIHESGWKNNKDRLSANA